MGTIVSLPQRLPEPDRGGTGILLVSTTTS
jgi:hypothetical protein